MKLGRMLERRNIEIRADFDAVGDVVFIRNPQHFMRVEGVIWEPGFSLVWAEVGRVRQIRLPWQTASASAGLEMKIRSARGFKKGQLVGTLQVTQVMA